MADRLLTGTPGNDFLPAHGGLVIVASASIGQDAWPHVNILVNGTLVGSTLITANVATGAKQAIVAALPAGTQVNTVTIEYTNDAQTDYTTDRNVFLSSVALNGTPLTLSSGTYVRSFDGSLAPAGYSNTDLIWGGTLTFSGAAVQSAGAPVPGGTVEIQGGAGLDTAVYGGTRSQYSFVRQSDGSYLLGTGGAPDTLVSVERVAFGDAKVALDINGAGGMAYRLYQAAFDRAPDLGGLGYWINALDTGASLGQVSQAFLGSAEFTTRYGANPTTEQYVTLLYQNVLDRAPDAGGFAYWVGNLNANALSRADTLAQFSESAENQAALIGVIENGMTFV